MVTDEAMGKILDRVRVLYRQHAGALIREDEQPPTRADTCWVHLVQDADPEDPDFDARYAEPAARTLANSVESLSSVCGAQFSSVPAISQNAEWIRIEVRAWPQSAAA